MPPAMSNREKNVGLERMNQVVNHFPPRQNREQTLPGSRNGRKTKLFQFADEFQPKRKLLPGHYLRLNGWVQLEMAIQNQLTARASRAWNDRRYD
jgi:hypothetical protein